MKDVNCSSSRGGPHFGTLLRQRRIAKGLSLRRFAQLIGVSPTYVSQIETGHFDPPTAERVRRMAELLGEPADALVACAGRVPEDLPGIIRERPVQLATFLRESRRLTAEQLQHLIDQARRLTQENRRTDP